MHCSTQHTWAAHHHANVDLHLLVNSIVQHNVHELIEAAQHARYVAVGVQLNCGSKIMAQKRWQPSVRSNGTAGKHMDGWWLTPRCKIDIWSVLEGQSKAPSW